MYRYIHTCIYAYIYSCIYTLTIIIYIHTYIHSYTHTHIHTRPADIGQTCRDDQGAYHQLARHANCCHHEGASRPSAPACVYKLETVFLVIHIFICTLHLFASYKYCHHEGARRSSAPACSYVLKKIF